MKSLIFKFFSWYITFILKKDFHKIEFNKPGLPEKGILLLANHFSWWDGFLYFYINKVHFKRKFYVMVSEENYKDVWFLKYLGAFPVYSHSKKMLESLTFAGSLLNKADTLLLVFPQGKLFSNHIEQVEVEKGVSKIIQSSQKNFQYLFAASFVDYFEKRKPSLYCYLQLWEGAEYTSLQLIKNVYNKHYDHSRRQHSRISV